MNITQIVNSVSVIEELMTQKIKITTAYKLKKIAAEVSIVVTEFEEKRKELLAKYATLNEDKTEYKFDTEDDGVEKFNNEMNAYLEGEDTLELDIKKIKLSEIEDLEIETTRLPLIEWFIEE